MRRLCWQFALLLLYYVFVTSMLVYGLYRWLN